MGQNANGRKNSAANPSRKVAKKDDKRVVLCTANHNLEVHAEITPGGYKDRVSIPKGALGMICKESSKKTIVGFEHKDFEMAMVEVKAGDIFIHT